MTEYEKMELVSRCLEAGLNSKRIKKLIDLSALTIGYVLLDFGLKVERLEKLIDDEKIGLVRDVILDVNGDREKLAIIEFIKKNNSYKALFVTYLILKKVKPERIIELDKDDKSIENIVSLCTSIKNSKLKKSIIEEINKGVKSIDYCYELVLKHFFETGNKVFKSKKLPEAFLGFINSSSFNEFMDRESNFFDFFEGEFSDDEKIKLIIRLLERNLTLDDYRRLPKLFKNFDFNTFLVESDKLSFAFIFNKDNASIISSYQNFFKYLVENRNEKLAKEIFSYGSFENEDSFIRMVRDTCLKLFDINSFSIPVYLLEFGFEIVQSYDTLDEMLKYNDKTFVKDSNQRNLLSNYSLDDIRRFRLHIKEVFAEQKIDEMSILNVLGWKISLGTKKRDIVAAFYSNLLDSVKFIHVSYFDDIRHFYIGFYDCIKKINIDAEDCKHYLKLGELNFIKYFQKNFENAKALLDCILGKEFNEFNDFIRNYFDENGISLALYKRALKNRRLLNVLISIDKDYLDKYSSSEKAYIRVLLQMPYISDSFIKEFGSLENINKYFGENSSIKDFYVALLSFNPSYIFKFDKNIVDKFFGEKGKLVYELLADLKSKGSQYYKIFSTYALKYDIDEQLTVDKIKDMYDALISIKYTNSREIIKVEDMILQVLSNSANPYQLFKKIESIFVKNELPVVGKLYKVFELLNTSNGRYMYNTDWISPTLKYSTPMAMRIIIFSDLLKITFGSNNRSIKEYLKNIKNGNNLYECIISGQLKYEELNNEQKSELIKFRNHLISLYHNTLRGQTSEFLFSATSDVVGDISKLSELLFQGGTKTNNLADRVISMFCHFAGIDTLEEAEKYIEDKVSSADVRNRQAGSNKGVVTLEIGDYVKGINDIKYLGSLLQNGVRAVEYLGYAAGRDSTPLDTDISEINTNGTLGEQISKSVSSGYGPIWFVLKNDDRFTVTRDNDFEVKEKFDLSRLEVFDTSDAKGIRTGFASSEINYIVCKCYDPRIGLEIVMNGFYIPVVDMDGKIIFTPEDYDNLRGKMGGLSYYSVDNFNLSLNLVDTEIEYIASLIEESKSRIDEKRNKINALINEVFQEFGLKLKTIIDGDLTTGYVEVIDTGSTGRNTNKIGDGDFDFLIRFDKSIMCDYQLLNSVKEKLKEKFGKVGSDEVISTGDFRFKKVKLGDEDVVDIDMSFVQRTDEIDYSTDMALNDRFNSIYKQAPEKYDYVLANIILAKQILSEGSAYKSREDGGLGGGGVENWILQNGGSFYDAAISFLECSEGKNFEEFKSSYYIWDFGAGHYAVKRGQYPYRNFVVDNMSSDGYDKMINALRGYIDKKNKASSQIYDRH